MSTHARLPVTLALAACVVLGRIVPALAQSVPAAERDAIVRLAADRGVRTEDVGALLKTIEEAGTKGLPVLPLANKVREGLAKGAEAQRIDAVVRQLAGHLGTADALLRELSLTMPAEHDEPITLLADALAGGVTPDEVRDLRRQGQAGGAPPLQGDSVAGAAKGLSLIKSASLPAPGGAAVMTEALRHGYRAHEMLEVGRQVKRRERDYREGRASLAALREAIARGERPEQIFRPVRGEVVERPAAARPDPAVERPSRPVRPETPVRPARPEVPERPAGGAR